MKYKPDFKDVLQKNKVKVVKYLVLYQSYVDIYFRNTGLNKTLLKFYLFLLYLI